MSDFHARIGWPVQAVPPRAPDLAPLARHDPPAGVGAFDWRWRHHFARRRVEQALADAAGCPVVPGADDEQTRRRVTALLRGCYVAMDAAAQERCVALAASAAAQAGIDVHVMCHDDEAVARVVACIETLAPPAMAGAPAFVAALRSDSMAALASSLSAARIVCGSANGLALAWLRGHGMRSSQQRAAARLGGDDAFTFSFAPLLLVCDADRVLLELVRQPLQLTAADVDAQARLLQEVAALVADFRPGEHFERLPEYRLLPAGDAILARVAGERAGLWSVTALVQSEVQAAIVAASLQADVDYESTATGVGWLKPQAEVLAGVASDDAMFARVERALRCRLGVEKAARTRVRAWLPEYLLGYARLGAAGADPGVEWRDIWWLTGMPVLDVQAQPPAIDWMTLHDALAPEVTVAFGLRSLQAGLAPRIAGLPAERQLCLERPEDRQHAAALLAEGKPLQVIGPLASLRHLPAGVSAIILLADPPPVPGSLPPRICRLALRLAGRGSGGRRVAAWLGSLALARQAAHQRKLRMALLERMRADRKTYAFTGRPRDPS